MIAIISSELEIIEKGLEKFIAGVVNSVMFVATFGVVHYYVRKASDVFNRSAQKRGGDCSTCFLLS